MGRFADFFREQSITLDGQKKVKMLSLDREFEDVEAERDRLKAENLHLRAQVKPLERDVDRLKERVEKKETDGLDELTENMLLVIANNPDLSQDHLFAHFKLSIVLKPEQFPKAHYGHYLGPAGSWLYKPPELETPNRLRKKKTR